MPKNLKMSNCHITRIFRYHVFDSEMSKSEGINDTALMHLRKGRTVHV